MSQEQKDPRRHGKLHYHEDEVRPMEAVKIIHKNPVDDLYHSPERGHPGRDVDLPLRAIQLHVARLDPGDPHDRPHDRGRRTGSEGRILASTHGALRTRRHIHVGVGRRQRR